MNVNSEDVFFYLDLTKGILKKKEIIRAIKTYISENNKINIKGHYGLLIFQEEGNPIFITGKKDSKIISNAIEENWKTRPKEQSFFENGLFYIFSYIAETVRKKSKYNRVIIITDTPSDLSEDYTEALFNLVSKIKKFPTFIDIIRISDKVERFFKDDVKLNILASDTKGEIFYIHEKKEFESVFNKLIKSKKTTDIFEIKSPEVKINKDDYDFYSRLAKPLILAPSNKYGLKCYFCKEEVCPLCTELNDVPLLCEDCDSAFHNCCVTNYIIENNIGIPHIFRCPNCDTLLKINQDDIVAPIDPKLKSAEEFIEREIDKEISEILKTPQDTLELKEEHNIKDSEEYSFKQKEEAQLKPKTMKIGGFFGKLYTVSKKDDKIVYQKVRKDSRNLDQENFNDKELTNKVKPLDNVIDKLKSWKPIKKTVNNFDENQKKMTVTCPQCRTEIKKGEIINNACPFCGYDFKK
jgi:hypothetical protein